MSPPTSTATCAQGLFACIRNPGYSMSKAAGRICQKEKGTRKKEKNKNRAGVQRTNTPENGINGESAALPSSAPSQVQTPSSSPVPNLQVSTSPEPVSAEPQTPSSTALAVAAKLEERLQSSEAHRRSLQQEAHDLRKALQDALHEIQRYEEMQNEGKGMSSADMSISAISNPQEWGHSTVDAERRVAKSQENRYKQMKHYVTGQLARAMSNEDDMKRRLARKEDECESLEQEAESLRAALRDALNGVEVPQTRLQSFFANPQAPAVVTLAQETEMQTWDGAEANRELAIFSAPQEWGHSTGDAEQRIMYSAQQHYEKMKQFAVQQIASVLASADEVHKHLEKSEDERRRLEMRLQARSTGESGELSMLPKLLSESEMARLNAERQAEDLRRALQQQNADMITLQKRTHYRDYVTEQSQQTDVSASASFASSHPHRQETQSSPRFPKERSAGAAEHEEGNTWFEPPPSESQYALPPPQDALPPPQDSPAPGPAGNQAEVPFTPKEGWVEKLSNKELKWNKRWLRVTGQFVVLSRSDKGGAGSKAIGIQGLGWQPLEQKQIEKLPFWLRPKAQFAIELIPDSRGSQKSIGPVVISVGSEYNFNAWITAFNAAQNAKKKARASITNYEGTEDSSKREDHGTQAATDML
eukprot:gnl/MRDRNA2_/MRDRNA2_36021_c0_seq1.p1 gnl/MRDRNA2_/MRDRNA2_36021_c0~~gnl/MRDRNA2_/MRDRNA2_36021_c0_seq1.p1  ORF type:complete len:646 (-),score=167.47 gnl/MRDRNA2_/MRDRNA2_36021_c0_seq1:36-1973(-)